MALRVCFAFPSKLPDRAEMIDILAEAGYTPCRISQWSQVDRRLVVTFPTKATGAKLLEDYSLGRGTLKLGSYARFKVAAYNPDVPCIWTASDDKFFPVTSRPQAPAPLITRPGPDGSTANNRGRCGSAQSAGSKSKSAAGCGGSKSRAVGVGSKSPDPVTNLGREGNLLSPCSGNGPRRGAGGFSSRRLDFVSKANNQVIPAVSGGGTITLKANDRARKQSGSPSRSRSRDRS
ncbi:unnamed protein product, partial [Amoebophrya sp. A25]|eukprot:GSA25T00013464001.1